MHDKILKSMHAVKINFIDLCELRNNTIYLRNHNWFPYYNKTVHITTGTT